MGTGTINSKRRYLDSLIVKHRALDKKIIERFTTASDQRLKELKVEKLNLKSKIAKLKEQIHNDQINTIH